MMDIDSVLTVAEYFAGIGLVRMGLERAGWKVAFANDISIKKRQMYAGFFPDAANDYVVKDVFDLDASEVPPTLLATCSFPCIDLSLAGNRTGINGRHSSAFWGFIRMLREQGESAPPIVLVENVTGWLSSNSGSDFRVTVAALNELGYACDVFNLDALRFTAQSRPRVFLLGVRGTSEASAQRIVFRPRSLASDKLKRVVLENADLRWFHQDIPEPPPLNTRGLKGIVEQLPQSDRRWWGEDEVERHLAMMEETHRARVYFLRDSEQVHYRTFFRRRRKGFQRAEVRSDDLSGCLRTAVGGSGKQFLIRAGRGEIAMRTMTEREYARLQGVPDSFPIAATGVQALTGFGDAVCVPVIEWIASNVLNQVAEEVLFRIDA